LQLVANAAVNFPDGTSMDAARDHGGTPIACHGAASKNPMAMAIALPQLKASAAESRQGR